MNSMTGYGRATADIDGRQLTIELKSVNHRFLDLNFRMPRSFAFLEEHARGTIAKMISRGHVDVFASYMNTREDAKAVTLDAAMLDAYRHALDDLHAATGMKDDRTLMGVIRLPEVIQITEADEDQDALHMLMGEAVAAALDELCAMRAREGKSLAGDILARVDALEALTVQIEQRYPGALVDHMDKMRARLSELIEGGVDEQRLAQELAIMADRSAIAEETVRLKSHFGQLRETIALKEPVGRKLDFIVQELNREVNTISSKSQDIPITQLVVQAKAEIEKVREQVQNIE